MAKLEVSEKLHIFKEFIAAELEKFKVCVHWKIIRLVKV
jgi:hypothetical protein